MKKSHKTRTFKEASENVDGHWRKIAIVACRNCAKVENLSIKTAYGLLPPVAIEKKFAQRGWEIGNNDHWDVCPDCVAQRAVKPVLKIVPKAEEPSVEEVVEVKPELVVKTEPPRVMQRDDRRIIFEKLNAVYLDEKRGYDNDWSDHKVATDLGVPRAWVEQVREEMFGPINTNGDIEDFMKGVAELALYKKQLEEFEKLRPELEKLRAAAQSVNLASMLERINKLEKLEALVKKHIQR
jgi:hypothetical protein